jgi:hypothetical protein
MWSDTKTIETTDVAMSKTFGFIYTVPLSAREPHGVALDADTRNDFGWLQTSRGAAAAIMRANPFSAIFAHCQLTLSRSGARTPAVVHTTFTSHPGAASVSALHSQTRPSSSVTRRDDIVGVSIRFGREPLHTRWIARNAWR